MITVLTMFTNLIPRLDHVTSDRHDNPLLPEDAARAAVTATAGNIANAADARRFSMNGRLWLHGAFLKVWRDSLVPVHDSFPHIDALHLLLTIAAAEWHQVHEELMVQQLISSLHRGATFKHPNLLAALDVALS
ncbi:hypothetical protein CMM_2294 [Clavibacter michiganensis subsp. michiganensis NCPPB 382]|nr:hypothetical protein CMM_2294 [Clavibacter michiganensis subsp. michiganensis NCPPB 382]